MEQKTESSTEIPQSEMKFDMEKWKTKDGSKYPYRNKMFIDVVYNDTIRSLNKEEIVEMLGDPDRTNENHLYYIVDEKHIGVWPLSTKSMVIKFSDDDKIDWIKIHE
jgi:hypothetical protein